MAYYDFLNVIFGPILSFPGPSGVLLISLFVSLLITLVTKYLTNQEAMKKLKEDMKEIQRQSKEAKGNAQRLMELQKRQMELTMEQFRHSLKPTLITFLPIILIFGWMGSVFAYEGIKPDQQFTITANFDKNIEGNATLIAPQGVNVVGENTKKIENEKAIWALKGKKGEHILEIKYNDEQYEKNILIGEGNRYIEPFKKTEGQIKSIQIDYKKRTILPIGYKDWFGWLGTYIWSSLIFTMLLRKVMKIY